MRQALELGLEFIERVNKDGWILADFEPQMYETITAIKEALAQPEQEPVAWATKEDFYRELERELKHIREEMKIKSVTMRCKDYDIALPIIGTDFGRVLVGQVSTPPQRKPLTRERLVEMAYAQCGLERTFEDWVELFAREIEAAHGIKE